MSRGRDRFLLHLPVTAVRTLLTFRQAVLCTGSFLARNRHIIVTGSGNRLRVGMAASRTGIRSHTFGLTSGFGSNRGDVVMRNALHNPLAVGIDIGSSGSRSFHIAAIRIHQFCRSDRDLTVSGLLHQLISNRLTAGIDFCNSTFGTGNCRTGGGGINIAGRSIHSAVDHNFSIHQIRGRTDIGFARSVGNRNKSGIAGANIGSPLVGIIHINVTAGAQCACDTFSDDDLRTGQQCYILIQGNAAVIGVHGDVAVDRQLVIRRIDRACTY